MLWHRQPKKRDVRSVSETLTIKHLVIVWSDNLFYFKVLTERRWVPRSHSWLIEHWLVLKPVYYLIDHFYVISYLFCGDRYETWPSYSTYGVWQTLLTVTRKLGRDHGILGELYNGHVHNQLNELVEDVQRVYKKVGSSTCRSDGIKGNNCDSPCLMANGQFGQNHFGAVEYLRKGKRLIIGVMGELRHLECLLNGSDHWRSPTKSHLISRPSNCWRLMKSVSLSNGNLMSWQLNETIYNSATWNSPDCGWKSKTFVIQRVALRFIIIVDHR